METAKPKTAAPAPAKPAPVVEPAKQDDMLAEIERQAKEIEDLRQRLADKDVKSEPAADELGPQVEVVNMGGLVMEKTLHADGDCEVQVLREPLIDAELIRATKAHHRMQGF